MATNRFSVSIEQLTKKVKSDLETVARRSALQLFTSVVQKSPVGNPDLWKDNTEAQLNRDLSYNIAKTQNKRIPSRRTLEKNFPNAVGKGYVGGRFRANWNFSYGTPDASTTESTDKARGFAEAQKAATMTIGGVAYLTNGLPYAKRLEFDAWSTQAPAGMVRISAIEFEQHVREAIRET